MTDVCPIDLERGTATVTEYDFTRVPGHNGTFNVNDQLPAGFVGAAVPYSWYTPDSGNAPAHGRCTGGINGHFGSVPTDKDGRKLCYTVTSAENASKSLNIMVMETCGGNCNADNPDTDCPVLGSHQYETKLRNYPTQKCPGLSAAIQKDIHITGRDAPDGPYANSAADCGDNNKHKDWCSGYYAHFDLDQTFMNKLGMGGAGVVQYKRIDCPV